ncbi:hypothetical protein NBRC110019_15500 [Neptunitalea chrysea]|uniref:Type I restriction modification DNA specificity domain-containing protein n=1 Tax=Neptunitalea chrysea TaxID=1647581 RepID=A0A9W6B4Q6_9FLAO|nr:restriction endonuclease subunit S [Neptunitalea chrysea]GLB52510.1 hypothetical protein NBRC110019_15500 [Neptunitalea chrysea]
MKNNHSYINTSKIDWLNKIPNHWKEVRLGSVFNERKEKVSDKDFSPLSVTKNGVVPQLDNAAKSNDGDNRKLVLSGDFAINSRSDRKGSSGLSIYDGSVSLINIVLKPIDIVPIFSQYLLKSYFFKEEYYRYGRGIVEDLWTTRYSEMKNMIIPIPPKPEQIAIANFLDYKTEKIDRFIKNKRQLLLHKIERRKSITTQIINSNTVKYLRLSVITNLIERPINRKDNSSFIPIGLYNRGRGIFHKPKTLGKDLGDSTFFKINKGDVILSGQFAWEGSVALAKQSDEGCIASHRYPILECNQKFILPEFLFSLFLMGIFF